MNHRIGDSGNHSPTPLRFIDLFAGLGGFHLALEQLGHKCVLACEVDADLADLYEQNFGLKPTGDIRALDLLSIPAHDILCAGFPCQPFSKAGEQRGLQCPQSGDLIRYVVRSLRIHRPSYFIIENVPNLMRHSQGATWRSILKRLRLAGYSVTYKLLSPHEFGVPQIRPRAFMVGRRGGLSGFEWPIPQQTSLSIRGVLDVRPSDARPLPDHLISHLTMWQEFLAKYPSHIELPSFPIWGMEFGATYPFEGTTPARAPLSELRDACGSLGRPLAGMNRAQAMAALPPYARDDSDSFPKWKVDFIRQNRELYLLNRAWIDSWKGALSDIPPSFQKLEWNCKGESRDVWSKVVQFRASGIRIKRPTSAPSLVALTTSQIPVIPWEGRYMTVRECSRLQSLQGLGHLPRNDSSGYRAMGNAVNSEVAKRVALALLSLPPFNSPEK